MAMSTIEDSPLCGYKTFDTRQYIMDDDFEDKTSSNEEVRGWRSFSRMMDSDYRPDSASTRGIHITEFSDSRVNPIPLLLEESDILLEQYLSPGKLQLLTGVDDLRTVELLELKVDSRETSLGNFGSLLPNLVELKLNGSQIACVRDLGSSLRKLKVLWMTRCGLEQLDGISAMSELKELYLEYNEISDISPLSLLEHLEVLDLEGNNIEDITQVQYLSLCPTLQKLALDGNPICVCPTPADDKIGYQSCYDFRETIKKLLPNLLILDDEALDGTCSASAKHSEFDEDWAYLEELQDEALLQDENQVQSEVAQSEERPSTAALRPATAYRLGSALRPSSGFRPLSASRQRPSTASGGSSSFVRPGTSALNRPVSSDAVEGIESVSELTMGNVICGNPSKSLRQRRQGRPGSKEDIDRKFSKLLQKGAILRLSDDVDDIPLTEDGAMSNIIEELRNWKLEHDKRMELIYKSKEAQVLVVDHNEDDEMDDFSDEDSNDDNDESDDLDEENTLNNVVDKYGYRHPYRKEINLIDLQNVDMSDVAERSSRDIYFEGKGREKLSSFPTAETVDFSTAETANTVSAGTADVSTARTTDVFTTETAEFLSERTSVYFSQYSRYDQSFDVEDDNLASGGLNIEVSPTSSYFPVQQQSISQSDVVTELGTTVKSSLHQISLPRNKREVGLAPLRVPNSSAQIINKIQYKTPSSPSSQQKKFRIGPTGLPLSSQVQQPVIRNNIAVIQSRSGLVQSCKPGSSQTNIVLLPSQPRIQRHLPDPPTLTSHPPRNS